MKAYIVYFIEEFDYSKTTKILGVYSSNEKAIDRVNRFELEELDEIFNADENSDEIVVDNHNNGFLKANLKNDYLEVTVDVKEVEIDSDSVINFY